jgi:uncharacterized protein (DUF1800 family)
MGGTVPTPGLAARVLTGRTASPRYTVAPYDATAVPTARELHLLDRLGAGYTTKSLKQLRRLGGYEKWFERQLKPAKVKESSTAAVLPSWYPALAWSTATKDARNRSGDYMAWEHARDLGNLAVLRRVYSNRQVLEQLTDFWSNHLHIPAGYDNAWIHRKSYDDLLRRYALTTFEALLVNATLHPAMQLFLDNYTSVKNAPNENHGRELLELHTVGREAGYTEQMVKDSAKILSGYTVSTDTWTGWYDPARHTTGKVTVLGFTSANTAADGRAVTVAYLRYLARHPATAKRICRKLAIRFVSDNPSSTLVNQMAKEYLRSGTAIKPVLRVMVASSEFWASRGKKVRTPYDDLIASCRSLRVQALKPTDDSSFGNVLNYVHGTIQSYQWPAPDGAPDEALAWTSVSRMLSSFRFHLNFAGGWWPRDQVSWHPPTYWLPKKAIRLDQLVDHLSRTWLGRRSTPRLLQAVCESLAEPPNAVVTADHQVMRWKFPRLAAVLLDSPQHLSR